MRGEADEYQLAIAPLREHLAEVYQQLFSAYLAAVRSGDVREMQALAERLDEAADEAAHEAETLWTRTLHTAAMDFSPAVFVNEAAGAMAMLSDLWSDLASAHRTQIGED